MENLKAKKEIDEADASLDDMLKNAAEKAEKSGSGIGKAASRAAGNATARGLIGGVAGIGKEYYDSSSEDRPFNWGNAAANAAIGAGASGALPEVSRRAERRAERRLRLWPEQ